MMRGNDSPWGRSKAAHSATWDGKVSDSGRLVAAAEGEYKVSIERRDPAGNTSRKGVKVALDRTLGFPTATAATAGAAVGARADLIADA